ncbi:hypothetical protein BDD12DRAFT_426762 [Trichophaea hybrida]|nr:hypothetical protein BDD12DRAFT_426762 [Trichophaea hybrida]
MPFRSLFWSFSPRCQCLSVCPLLLASCHSFVPSPRIVSLVSERPHPSIHSFIHSLNPAPNYPSIHNGILPRPPPPHPPPPHNPHRQLPPPFHLSNVRHQQFPHSLHLSNTRHPHHGPHPLYLSNPRRPHHLLIITNHQTHNYNPRCHTLLHPNPNPNVCLHLPPTAALPRR